MISNQQAVLLGYLFGSLLFAISAYLTQAPRRRILAALVGALAYALLNNMWDRVATSMGWWTYPFPNFWLETLLLYIPGGLVMGGAFGLVGWRVTRRFGGRGLAGFLVCWGVCGLVRDFSGAAVFQVGSLITFVPGTPTVIADLLNYGTCGALAQVVISSVGGPAKDSPLRLRPTLSEQKERANHDAESDRPQP